ncbi:unnamed protein product [Closterium sp. Yama58-4]|nr:unnamed protein product [Closterium sp. Yama58-4]
MLAATSFGWVAKQIDLLTGDKARSAVSIENIKAKGLKSLRDSMVEYICTRVAEKRSAAPTSRAVGTADNAIDDDGAESQTAPQAADADQHQSSDSNSESESEGEGEDEAAKEKVEEDHEEEEEEEEEDEDENDEVVEVEEGKDEAKNDEEGVEAEVQYELQYEDSTVVALGSADEKNEEAEDGDAGNAMRSAEDGGKEKDEVGAEATTEQGPEEAACEGAKVSVDAGEGANITGMQETKEASGRQGPEQVDVEELLRENLLLRAENARLKALLDEEQARLDAFFVGLRGLVDHLKELAEQIDDTDKFAAQQLRNAAEAMSQTITGNITGSFDEAWKTMKTFAEQASAWLEDFDNPEGRVACARAEAVDALAEHVNGVVGAARRGLELYITTQLSAAQVNIATAVTSRLPVQPPPPPQPTPPALPEELLKSFKADIMKTVTEATQQSFVASGMKMLTEMIGTVAPGRRGSSPSANDADQAQRRAADKQGEKRTGDGDDKESVKRSKGSDGSRATKPPAQIVVEQLKSKAGWKVISTSNSKGSGSGKAEGGPADGVAANVAAPPGPPLVAEQTKPQATSGKGVTDKEAPTAQAANDGGARTTKGPSVAVAAKGNAKAASAKSIPRKSPAATPAPAGRSSANNDGPAIAAPPAPAAPTADKGDATAAAAKPEGPSPAKVPAGSNALREMLRRMDADRRDVQQPPVVDAALAETARRSVTSQVVGKSTGAPPAVPLVAAPTPAEPKSAFLRAHLGARKAGARQVTQPEPGKSATPTSVNATSPTPGAAVVDAAAEKGVSAALATGGRADRHANLAAVLAQFEAAKRPEHAPALAIMDTAHAEPSETHGGGSAEPTAATAAVAEGNAGQKGKDGNGKGKAVSQRSTRAMSAGNEMSEEKGKKPARNQDKTGGEHKPAKRKAKAEEEEEEEEEEEGEEEEGHGRRGHGIRRDRSGDGLGWVGEIKIKGQNRYIGKSRDKMELAYEHAIAYLLYNGYVSKVLTKELTVLKPGQLDEWKAVWEELRFLSTGMWTVMWARGLCHPRARFDDILGRYRGYASSGDALHDVLWPAIWFPIIEDTEAGKAETTALLSAMVNRVSMCAAYGKVAASVAFGKVDTSTEGKAGENAEMEGAGGKADEKTEMGAQALAASACALWCYMSTGASVLGAVGEGKAAAMVAGAGEERAERFKKVDAITERKVGENAEMEGAEGKADEKTEMGAQALAASACALWCYMSTGASVLGAVGEGKAAAMVAGAGEERAERFKKVMHLVFDFAKSRKAPAGEVAHNVAPELQRYGVARAFEAGIEEVEADMIARATVETLAFWGMCPVAGPKLKAEGIDVPCDAKMEYDLEHRGRKGEKVKQGKGSKRKKTKAEKQAKDSTDA